MTMYDLFDGLDRCGPGDEASLLRACAGLRPGAAVLDAGAGRGADLGRLASLVPGGRVVAVDLSPEFIAHIRATHPAVRAEVADMADPPGGPFDLIWSAGAIYQIGVEAGLRGWRRHLAPGGRVAFTDLVLRGDAVSAPVRGFFEAEGVTLRGEAAIRAEVAAAGYRVVDAFWLPDAAWEAYYGPLLQRFEGVRPGADAETLGLIELFDQEIAIWRDHGRDYGYLCIVAVPE